MLCGVVFSLGADIMGLETAAWSHSETPPSPSLVETQTDHDYLTILCRTHGEATMYTQALEGASSMPPGSASPRGRRCTRATTGRAPLCRSVYVAVSETALRGSSRAFGGRTAGVHRRRGIGSASALP